VSAEAARGPLTHVLSRAAGYFLADEARDSAAPPPAARAVVLGTPADAPPLAAALALSLRAAGRAPAAVVAVWAAGGIEAPRSSAAVRSAARLASQLSAHGLAAAPRGRLAWLALPPDPDAAADVVRSASLLVDVPLVTALGGARPDALESLIAEHDLAVVAAEPESSLARAALAALAARGVAASAYLPPRRGISRALAMAGIAAPRLDARGRGEEA
jgi:hypothetical protein